MLGRQFVCEAQLANLRGSPEWSRSRVLIPLVLPLPSAHRWLRGRAAGAPSSSSSTAAHRD